MNTDRSNHQPSPIELIKSSGKVDGILITILLILSPLVIISMIRPLGIFYSNQHLYYLNGMYEAGVEYLQNDPEAAGHPYHLVFSKLVYMLESAGWLAPASQLLSAVLVLIFGAGCLLFAVGTISSWRQREGRSLQARDIIIAVLIASIFINLINRSSFTHISGMAGMSMVSRYLQASGFSVFIVPGIGLLLLKRRGWATLCFTIASAFHTHYFILSSPLMLILLWEAYRDGKLKSGILLCGIYGLINLPLFAIEPLYWSQLNGEEARYILNSIRSPHHYSIAAWWNVIEAIRLFIIGAAVVFALWKFSSTLWMIFLTYFGMIASSIAIVAFTDNLIVQSLVPWRASSFTLPLAQMLIVGTLIIIIFELLSEKLLTPALLITTIVTAINLISLNPLDIPPAYKQYTTPEIDLVREHTTEQDIVLIPPRIDDSFRLYAERPIFVTWKATGYDVMDWYNRVLVAEEMQTANLERRVEICGDYDFAYYMVAIETFNGDETTAIDRTEGYLLFACP